MSNKTNKHTYKQYEKIQGQIFYGGFSSETECSERKKKMKKQTNYWKREMLLCCAKVKKQTNQVNHIFLVSNQTNKYINRLLKKKILRGKSSIVDSRARPNTVKEKKK